MRASINTVFQAADLMRAGSTLQQMHSKNGLKWYLVPGGEIAERIANGLLARPDVRPANDGLFPGISQTFQLRSFARRNHLNLTEREHVERRRIQEHH